jgi:hypothetical protein
MSPSALGAHSSTPTVAGAAAVVAGNELQRGGFELQQHGLESVEREVRWLNELIQNETSEIPPTKKEQ